jgi:VanZ family protein
MSMHALTFLANWAPVALWATLIFYFSTGSFSAPETSQILEPALNWLFPGISADQFEIIHLIIRKLGHWGEYFVFALLVLRALRRQWRGYAKLYHNAWTIGIVFLYAASDELHQVFVPHRTASFADVLLDTLGGICAVIWIILVHRWKKITAPMDR